MGEKKNQDLSSGHLPANLLFGPVDLVTSHCCHLDSQRGTEHKERLPERNHQTHHRVSWQTLHTREHRDVGAEKGSLQRNKTK